jgi:uncharacterized delta-60 repeat protein
MFSIRRRQRFSGRDASRRASAAVRSAARHVESLESRVLLAAQIYVTDANAAKIGVYDTNGSAINASLITGLAGNTYANIAVSGSDVFISNFFAGTIGEYTTSGATINASLVTGLNAGGLGPFGITVSGSQLFVAMGDGGSPGTSGVIGEYDLGSTPGTIAASNPNLITGLADPGSVVVSGTSLFLTDYANGLIGAYTTSGATINASLVSGLVHPEQVAISGSDLFVTTFDNNTVGEYTTSGAVVNASLLTNLAGPCGIAALGNDLFVNHSGTNSVGEYTTSGATVNASLITGLTGSLNLTVTGTSGPQSTTTTALSSTNPAALGSSVTLTAIVAGSSPSGTVTFLDNGTPIGTGTIGAGGVATLGTSSLTTGTHSITASFPGDNNNIASTSAVLNQSIVQPKVIGQLDPTFGINGIASQDVGFTATSGLAVQPDGKSVIAGVIGSPGSGTFGLTRYNADGSLDTAFAGGGVASVGFGGDDEQPASVVVLPNGQILEAGTSTLNGVGSQFAVARFNADGSLDTTFGSGTGTVLTSFAANAGTSTDTANAIIPGTGGAFFIVGSSDANGAGKDFAIAAYNADGTPNTSFNGSGRELLDFSGGDDSANAAVLQSNGELVVAGSTQNPSTLVTSVALVRLLPNGALDSHFGTKGKVVTNLRGVDDEATSIAIGAKGAIVVGGLTCTGSFADGTLATDFAVLRYTSTGKADHTFGGSGHVITSFGVDSAVTKVIVQSTGQIVVSGKTISGFTGGTLGQLGIAIARYNTNGSLDTSFNGTGKTVITLTGQSATVSVRHASTIRPFATEDQLRQEFDSFVSSAQGVIATTPGGDIAVVGNSGTSTEEGQLVASGIDLAASLLGSLPASEKKGAFATVSISVSDNGSAAATGTVTVELFVAESSTTGAGDVQLYSKPQAIKLKALKAKSFKLKVKLPSSLTAGTYFLVGVIDNRSLQDLNPVNNIAFKGPFQIVT